MPSTVPTTIKINTHGCVQEDIIIPDGLTVLEEGQTVSQHHRMFRILSTEKGDERLTWDSRVLTEIRAAGKMFADLIAKGLKPFRVDRHGKATNVAMTEFDPAAEEVIFLPHKLIAGG